MHVLSAEHARPSTEATGMKNLLLWKGKWGRGAFSHSVPSTRNSPPSCPSHYLHHLKSWLVFKCYATYSVFLISPTSRGFPCLEVFIVLSLHFSYTDDHIQFLGLLLFASSQFKFSEGMNQGIFKNFLWLLVFAEQIFVEWINLLTH